MSALSGESGARLAVAFRPFHRGGGPPPASGAGRCAPLRGAPAARYARYARACGALPRAYGAPPLRGGGEGEAPHTNATRPGAGELS